MKQAARTPQQSSYALIFLSSCLLGPLLLPAGVRAALPETAKLLPPDTAFVVKIRNFSQLREQFEKTDLFNLYKDPSMAPFVNDFKKKLKEKIEKEDSELAKIVTDAATFPEGKVAVALALNAETLDTKQPPIMFIAEWGGNAGQVRDMVNEVVAKAVEEKGARKETEDYRGVGITSITGKSSDAVSYCFIDDAMILSGNPETMKFVIAQAKGAGSQTLADSDNYNSTLRAVKSSGAGEIDVYVNIKHIMQTVTAKDEAGKVKPILTNLGLDNVTSFGLSIDVGSGPGGTSSGKALLKIDGAKKGISKLLEVESGPIRVPRFVSESVNSVSVVNLDMKKAFDEMVKILTAFSPQMAMMLNMPLSPPGQQGEPPLQLKTGIIDHLGSQIVVAQNIDKSAQGGPKPESLVALAVTNRASLEKTLLFIHSGMIAPGKPDARRELLGHTIYSVDLAGMMGGMGGRGSRSPMMQGPGGAGMPGMPKLAFTVTDTHLIFASEDAVERAIRTLSSSGNQSVASTEWFSQAKATIPSSVGLAGLQNTEASMEAVWSALRNMKMPNKGGGRATANLGLAGAASPEMMLSQMAGDLVDFSLLPNFDAVRKYFGLSASYGISRQDGFFFEFKYINPK